MKKFLFTTGLLAVSFATLWGQFKYVKVDAPFSMEPIKEFMYPDQDFSIVNYGAVKGGRADVSDAIAGAITGKRVQKKRIDSLYIKVTLNNG